MRKGKTMANFCEKCGSPLTKDDVFCPNCGTKADVTLPGAQPFPAGANKYQYAGGYAKSKSKLVPIIAGAVGLVLVIVCISLLTSKSRGIKGTWYYIYDADPTSEMNIEITKDTVDFDYLSYPYKRDGDYIILEMYGEDRASFRIGTYDGQKVLYEAGESFPEYARTLEGAEKSMDLR